MGIGGIGATRLGRPLTAAAAACAAGQPAAHLPALSPEHCPAAGEEGFKDKQRIIGNHNRERES